jgi:hypothetical protein
VREKISVHSRWRHQLDSLDDAGQLTSVRATNAIERLHEEFKRRIKTQAFLPNAETRFGFCSPQRKSSREKVDGWQNLFKALARIHGPRRMIRCPQTAGESLRSIPTPIAPASNIWRTKRVFIRSRTYLRANPSLNGLLDQVRRKPRTGVQL